VHNSAQRKDSGRICRGPAETTPLTLLTSASVVLFSICAQFCTTKGFQPFGSVVLGMVRWIIGDVDCSTTRAIDGSVDVAKES
jgi:hypothetical protein